MSTPVLVKCKACGYILPEGRVKDLCPACGFPRTVFEPYADRVSEKRKRILAWHLHPMIVHLPQAYAATVLVLCLLALAVGPWLAALASAIRVLLWGLPVVLVGTALSGLLDGRTRFRRVTTPALKTKIYWGSLFIVISAALLALASTWSGSVISLLVWLSVLDALAMVCSIVLGRLGAGLQNAILPG